MSDVSIYSLIHDGEIVPSISAPTTDALAWAIVALENYEYADDVLTADDEHEERAHAQALADVIAFLERTIATRQRRSDVAAAKRAFAAEHGVPVSQVRIAR